MQTDLTEANLATVGRFAEELEVQAGPNSPPFLPTLNSIPALTTSHSQASSCSIASLGQRERTSSMISPKDLESALDAQRAINPFMAPTTKLKKSLSLNGLDNPTDNFYNSYDSSKEGDDDNVISISLADFDNISADLEVGPSTRRSNSVSDELDKSLSNISLDPAAKSGIVSTCPSYSSLNATVDPPIKDQEPPSPLKVFKAKETAPLSSSLPVTSTESTNRFRNPLVRKKFVLQPQHISSYSEPKSTDRTYTSELPEMFRLDQHKSALSDSYTAKIRRKVNEHPPPQLPAHLESSFINSSAKASKDADGSKGWNMPMPSHVVLNHLATASLKHEMLAVATTTRYREKFITQILYEPI